MYLLSHDSKHGFRMTRFTGPNTPPYAILSHTWGADEEEVTFADIANGKGADKSGYEKIRRCGDQASRDGLDYFWVDCCCIDQKSSAELSEAINSMYAWYHNAQVCYAFIGDYEHGPHEARPLATFSGRWFTRGWTLQELIAPPRVEFYDRNWRSFGTKESLSHRLQELTGIDANILKALTSIKQSSVAQRMSWLANRKTTRPEDMAYCMLGIFDVNLPLLYGEGGKAFLRLQEEIIRYVPPDSFDSRFFNICICSISNSGREISIVAVFGQPCIMPTC